MNTDYATYELQLSNSPTEMDPNGALENGYYIAALRKLPQRRVMAEKGLNVRKGPGPAFDRIGVLKCGQVVTIYEEKGEWARIAEPVPAWMFMRQLGL